MNLPQNVGRLDAYLRITFGLSALVWGASRRLGRWGPLLTLAGAMKVAEGLTRYCPMLHAVDAMNSRTASREEEQAHQGADAGSELSSEDALWKTPRGMQEHGSRQRLRSARMTHLPED